MGFLFVYLLGDCFFSGGGQGLETSEIVDRHFAQHLAVNRDVGFLKTEHELAVAAIAHSACGVDPFDPQFAEVTFDEPTADISILAGMVDLFLSGLEQQVFAAEETRGSF